MAVTLSLQLCKVLCSNGGSMELGQLGQALRLSPEKMSRLIEAEEGRRFVIRSTERDKEQVAVYASPLRICADRKQECTGNCGRLHVCRYFILGSCNRPHCKFSHSIDSGEATRILQEHHINGVTIPELRYLLLQNDPHLLPDVCLHYNRGDGPHGSCTFKTNCNKLHVCQHFLHGDCKFGSKCKRSHDLDSEETKRKLLKWGLAASLIPVILQIYLNASAIKNGSSATPTPEPRSPDKIDKPVTPKSAAPQPIDEICLYFILNNCSFKDRCVRDHYHLPYRWQICMDGTWKDLADMEATEQAYCDPNSRGTTLNFDTMTYRSYKMRRLSTQSSASKAPHFVLTTDWLWYWKDEYNQWVEYGKETGAHTSSATITSNDLENVFLSDENTSVQFKAGKHSYVLSFKEMIQRNTKYGTERPVCRRPAFVSAEEVKKRKLRKSDPSKGTDKSTPQHWDKGQIPDVGYKLVRLSESSEEYKKIDSMFHRTLPSQKIQSIERIQNPALWEIHQWQKEQMKKRNGGKEVDERQVFHGTGSSLVDAICQQNFDWRVCGANGTAYGKGSYFARDASYSHRYCSRADSLHHIMFVARVLVGDFIRGSSSYLRPPAKSTSSFYDSCVDSESNPSIFVIFEKHQIYPEYLIRYSDRQDDVSALSSLLRAFK
ncbi:protein mono-ADP-ribosyltransferase PARP12-like [Bufo gargarizans]|uniref:protein mono-ADP-ribosyltransferase PARP12-like n=1 Tax=Bufo gargarizans TaxID=30331 RepID=UPI001CF3572E|nr:protein mono-ADP-ribosyltransferase PARP12-like [Bufo gargarizans]